jgi:hypothetical protein
MRLPNSKRTAFVVMSALTMAGACREKQNQEPAQAPPTAIRVDSSGGETSQFSLMKDAVGWLTDSNIVSLAAVVNDAPMALSRAESQSWTDQPTHEYALMVLRDHAALQASIDSLASHHHLPAQAPAIGAEFHAKYDSAAGALTGLPAAQVDPKFLAQMIELHGRTILDFGALAGNTTDPDLRALLSIRAQAMEQQHLTRAQQLTASLAAADSAKQAAKQLAKPPHQP